MRANKLTAPICKPASESSAAAAAADEKVNEFARFGASHVLVLQFSICITMKVCSKLTVQTRVWPDENV